MMIFSAGFLAPAAWGVVLLVSWIGWGEWLRMEAGIARQRVGWGIRAAWGMGAMLAVCGFFECLGVGNASALLFLTIAGVGVSVFRAYESIRTAEGQRRVMEALRWRRWIAYSPVIVLLIYLYLSSVVAFDMNWWDDLANYAVYGKKLLQTGSMVEPFSLRRLLTYGGQQTLDAAAMIGGSFRNIELVEQGLSRVVFAAMLLDFARPRGERAKWAAGIAVVILLLATRSPLVSVNTHAEMTGVVLVMGLMGMLTWEGGWRSGVGSGVVGAALGTLRVNFLPMAVISIVLAYGVRMAMDRRRWRYEVLGLLTAAATFGVVLLPWALALKASSGTLLYPVWEGNGRAEYAYFHAGLSVVGKAARVVGFAGTWTGLLLVLPVALTVFRRFCRTALPMGLAAGTTAALTMTNYTLTSYENIYRYVFPALFGVGAVAVMVLLVRGRTRLQVGAAGAVLVLLGIGHVVPGVEWLVRDRGAIWTRGGESPLLMAMGSGVAYQKAQESVPAGKEIFSATSFPVMFDFARNPIVIADFPGGASPPPGMPLFEGGAAVKEYLKGLGIEYVVLTLPERDMTLYSREYWTAVKEHPEAYSPDVVRRARFDYQFMVDMGELMGSSETLYRSRTLCVLHLR